MKKLGSNTQANIIKRLDQLDEMRGAIIKALSLSDHNIQLWPVVSKHTITLFTSDPIFATKLKYEQKKIRTHLNNLYKLNLKYAHTKLIPAKIASKMPEIQSKPINESASKVLSSIAIGIEDSELRNILENISKR